MEEQKEERVFQIVEVSDRTKIYIKEGSYAGRKFIDIRKWVETSKYTGFTQKGITIPLKAFEEFKEKLNKVKVVDGEKVVVEE